MAETPVRDIEQPAPAPAPAEAEAPAKGLWRDKFNVKQEAVIETVDRMSIIVGVNEYKGNYLVFLAKATSPNFARQFLSMPAYVWDKAIPALQKFVGSIAEVEKKAMADAVLTELKRLKDLGIDIKALASQV